MAKYAGIILGILMFFGGFFVAKTAKAVDEDVVINEVMISPNCLTTESNCEWFELLNRGDFEVDLSGWTFSDNSGDLIIISDFVLPSHDYVVISATDENFKDFSGNLIVLNRKLGNGLANGGDHLILRKGDQDIDSISWGGATKGHSIERKPAGLDTDALSDFIDQERPTPGSGIPASVFLEDPKIDDGIIYLTWSRADEDGFNKYEIYLSNTKDQIGEKIDELEYYDENYYEIDDLASGSTYYFVVRNFNSGDNYSDSNQAYISLTIIYSKNIIINEICPHPQNGVENEFIELFNTGNQKVDLGGWFLDDVENSGSAPYEIPADTKIQANGYIAFYKAQTKISLADNGDTARLLFPNGNLASLISYNEYASLGYSWARKSDGSWQWTTTPTLGDENKFTQPITEEKVDTEEPINTVPIEISTGSFQDYLNKLVKVTGKVTSTSGNTFYLDDGSGEVKIYIQEKTGIDKPEMHKGDIFEVVGIVDLYGKTWRILPQKQNDIQLIEATVKSSTAKSSSTKKTSSVIKSIGAAANIGPKKVEAADNSPPSENSTTPLWMQIMKATVAIALILFIVLIIRLRQRPKEKIIGGDFGDDET